MPLIGRISAQRLWRLSVRLTAAAVLVILPQYVAAGAVRTIAPAGSHPCLTSCEPSPVANAHFLLGGWDHRLPVQEPESLPDGCSQSGDCALRPRPHRSFLSAGENKLLGPKWSISGRVSDRMLTLPMSRGSVHAGRFQDAVPVAWPMGQSAAESVVLLRRLLI